jgi:hypothetical protein
VKLSRDTIYRHLFAEATAPVGDSMSDVPLWFERKFDLSFPVELYPNVIARLRGTPARIEELVREQPPSVMVRKDADKWSAQEHAGHLLDLEPLWFERVDDFLNGHSKLTAADLQNRKTHEADHNSHPIEKILTDFRIDRRMLVERVEKIDLTLFERTLLHPRLNQPMRLVDHLYFVAEHDDHHLARIWELAGN